MKYHWGKYAHVMERGGVAACFNALKMRPVFIDLHEAGIIRQICLNGATTQDLEALIPKEDLDEIIPELLEAKVLYEDFPKDVDAGYKFGEIAAANASVQYLYLVMTDKCNLNCYYCFLRNRDVVHSKGKMMSSDVACDAAVRFAEQLMGAGRQLEFGQVMFYGGEPLINFPVIKDFIDALEKIRRENPAMPRIIYTMASNATLVTEEIAEYLAFHNVIVGVSLDGPEMIMEERPTLTGENSFKKVIQGIAILREKGVPISASCTLNEKVLEKFDEVMYYLLQEMGFGDVSLNMILPNPGESLSADYCNRATEAMIKCWELCQKIGAREDRIVRKINAIKKFVPYPYDCAACGSQIFVDPEGMVGLCQGNLGKKERMLCSVSEPFNLKDYDQYNKMRRRTPLLMEACQNCPAIGICGGGCALAAEASRGDILALDERFCVHSKMCLNWIIWEKIFPNMEKIGK